MTKKEKAIAALKTVEDPELGIDVWTLGLIYDLNVKNGDVDIRMTFTTPLCPFGPQIVNDIKQALKEQSFNEPAIEVVFEPLWEPTDEVREMLGLM